MSTQGCIAAGRGGASTCRVNTGHIFISSAFRDMRAERDHLAAAVVPELREKAKPRFITYILTTDIRSQEGANHAC